LRKNGIGATMLDTHAKPPPGVLAGACETVQLGSTNSNPDSQNIQPQQLKFEPLRLATAKAFFEKRVRGLSGIDEADRYIFEGHITAATWIPNCDAQLERPLIDYLEAVRSCAKAAIVLTQKRELLTSAICAFNGRTWRAYASRQGGFPDAE
jgi:hypothetical protein